MLDIKSLFNCADKETHVLHPADSPSFNWTKATTSTLIVLIALVVLSTIITNRIEAKGTPSTIIYSLFLLIGAATGYTIKQTYDTFTKERNEFNSIKNDLQNHASRLGDIGSIKAAAELDRETRPQHQFPIGKSQREIAEAKIIASLNTTPSLTLIVGPYRSSKNALVSHVLTDIIKQSNQDNIPLWYPGSSSVVREVQERKLRPRHDSSNKYSIIFLEHLDRFMSDPNLFHWGILRQWVDNGCSIIATIENPEFEKYRTEIGSKTPNSLLSQGWDLINRFTLIDLNDILNEEISLSRTDIAKLKNEIEYEWRQSSWLAALLRSAANWRYVGLGPAPREQLEALAISCTDLTNDDNPSNFVPDWDNIWKEATSSTRGPYPLITQVGFGEWQIFDSVFEVISEPTIDEETGLQRPLAEPSLGTLMKMTYIPGMTTSHLISIAWAMRMGSHYDEATSLFELIANRYPEDPLAISEHACFKAALPYADRKEVADLFNKAYRDNTDNARFLREYASFLRDNKVSKEDFELANKISEESHALNTNDWRDNLEFAFFLESNFKHSCGEYTQIENLYIKALSNAEDSLSRVTVAVPYAVFLCIKLNRVKEATKLFNETVNEVATDSDSLSLLRYPLALLKYADKQTEAQSAFDVLQRRFADIATLFIWTSLGSLRIPPDDRLEDIHTFLKLSLPRNDENLARSICNFILFAYSHKYRLESGRALKSALCDTTHPEYFLGDDSDDRWNNPFKWNLAHLLSDSDPRRELLEAVAQALGNGDTSRLEAFEEWRDL